MKLKRGEKPTFNTDELIKRLNSNPMDVALYKFIEKFDKKNNKSLSEILGIREREPKKLVRDMEETLEEIEDLNKNIEDEEVEEVAKVFEGDNDEKVGIRWRNILKNKDIASLFLKKHSEFSGKKLAPAEVIRKHKWKNSNRVKQFIKKLSSSKFFSLLLLLNRADPLEAEAILNKLLPALIQSGATENQVKEIANILMASLEKGTLKGSREFFKKLYSIAKFLQLFGGSNKLTGLLREAL